MLLSSQQRQLLQRNFPNTGLPQLVHCIACLITYFLADYVVTLSVLIMDLTALLLVLFLRRHLKATVQTSVSGSLSATGRLCKLCHRSYTCVQDKYLVQLPSEKHWYVFFITTAGMFSACSVRWGVYATQQPLYGKYERISVFTERYLVIHKSEGIENDCCKSHLRGIYSDSLRAITMSCCRSFPRFLKLILMKAGIWCG